MVDQQPSPDMAGAPRAIGWRPVSTAPKDGTLFLAYGAVGHERGRVEHFISCWRSYWSERDDEYLTDGWWHHDSDIDGHRGYPTHWMPLPEAPMPNDTARLTN